TAELQLLAFDLDHVPAGIGAALHLGTQDADTAVPALVDHALAGRLEGLEIDLLLSVLIGTAPGNHGQRPVCRRAERSEADGGHGCSRNYKLTGHSHLSPPRSGILNPFCAAEFSAARDAAQYSCRLTAARRDRRPRARRSAPRIRHSARR